jgi:hypothetical protein
MSDCSFSQRYKQILRYPLLVLLLVCSTAVCADPVDQDGVLTLTLRVANYEDGPVQIVGLKHAEESGKEPCVHLRNTSFVKTSRIWVQAEVRDSNDPQKRPSRTNSNVPNLRWPAERTIQPGADVWAHETVLRSDSIAIVDAKELHTRCVFATISVMSVEFADGTSWMAGVKGAGKLLRYSDDSSHNENPCKNSASTETGGHEIDGAIVRRMPQPEKFINWEDENSYSISCPLIVHEGKYYAGCPF